MDRDYKNELSAAELPEELKGTNACEGLVTEVGVQSSSVKPEDQN